MTVRFKTKRDLFNFMQSAEIEEFMERVEDFSQNGEEFEGEEDELVEDCAQMFGFEEQ